MQPRDRSEEENQDDFSSQLRTAIRVTDENLPELYPHLKEWKERVTKVVFTHLDNTQSEMKLTFPIFSFSSEMQELTNFYLSQLINDWTRNFITIKSYEVMLGSKDQNGNENYSLFYEPDEIPLNKVWVPAKRRSGSWKSPQAVFKMDRKKKQKHMEKNMANGLHVNSGHPVKSRSRKIVKGIYLN